MWNGFYQKYLEICSEYIILLVESIPTCFCWLTCRKQKLVQSKTLQQVLFVLTSDFWQFRHSNFIWGKLNLEKFKLHRENWHGRGVHFSEPVQVQKVESVIRTEWLQNSKQKMNRQKNRLVLCVLKMCLNSKKTSSRSSKRISRKIILIKKDFLKKPLVTMIVTC